MSGGPPNRLMFSFAAEGPRGSRAAVWFCGRPPKLYVTNDFSIAQQFQSSSAYKLYLW